MRRLFLIALLSILLTNCGGSTSPSTSSTSSTPSTPENTAKQLVAALIANDQVAVLSAFDSDLPTRYAERTRIARSWTERQSTRATAVCDTALGPFKSDEIQPAVMRGESATVRVVLHHELGDAYLDLEMRQTSNDGWRVSRWDSKSACMEQ